MNTQTIRVAITQMKSRGDWQKNCDAAETLVRSAAAVGANLILLQELFDGDYFCIEQHVKFLALAEELAHHRTVVRFAALAKELGIVLPVSVFERAGQAHYNTTVIVDADGTRLGHYRKSHIPDGRGYQEKFYFSPGDTGFKVWDTGVGRIGLGICWDQWFPECARAMALMGAEILLYPTAIGSEPPNPGYDSSSHWQNCMRGHAASNILPVIASNRVGTETAPDGRSDTFYGRSFISDWTGDKVAEMDRVEEGFRCHDFNLGEIATLRRSWGVFRDRRPELYGSLLTIDGKTRVPGM
jgi:N-carbamoylputrescine amidase